MAKRAALKKVFAEVVRSRKSKKFTSTRRSKGGSVKTKARAKGNRAWKEDKISGKFFGTGADVAKAGLGVGIAGLGIGGGVGLSRSSINARIGEKKDRKNYARRRGVFK